METTSRVVWTETEKEKKDGEEWGTHGFGWVCPSRLVSFAPKYPLFVAPPAHFPPPYLYSRQLPAGPPTAEPRVNACQSPCPNLKVKKRIEEAAGEEELLKLYLSPVPSISSICSSTTSSSQVSPRGKDRRI